MSDDEKFDFPDADIILRTLGPPARDFRAHKLILSLASSVFKDMFSLAQPTPDSSRTSTAAEVEIVGVTDPPGALDIILRMVYPFAPPSFGDNIDALVECLTIADKYDIRGAKSQLCSALAQINPAHSLRVYAIAVRFGFADLVESISCHIVSSVDLTGIHELPDDFRFIPATVYHKLVRHRKKYLEAAGEIVKWTLGGSCCYSCLGRTTTTETEEVFRLRLAYLIVTGTPVEAGACSEAWVRAYGRNAECRDDCVSKFISSTISEFDRGRLAKLVVSAPRKKG